MVAAVVPSYGLLPAVMLGGVLQLAERVGLKMPQHDQNWLGMQDLEQTVQELGPESTDTHLLLVDLRPLGLTGRDAEQRRPLGGRRPTPE